jgi:hypothetical protein
MKGDPDMWRTLKTVSEKEPLRAVQVGVDPHFVLSSQYEWVMPGIYHVDPTTGTKAWAEPALVLVVSVDHPDWPSPQHLYYGLSRSDFTSGLDPRAEDRSKLMAAALPLLKTDIQRLGSSDVPDSLPKTRFI